MNKNTISYVLMAFGVVGTAIFVAVFFMNSSRPPQQPDKPIVMTSIQPISMIVSEVAGDRFDVRALLSPSDSPHTFAFTPSTRAGLEEAKAFVYVDAGLEPWAPKVDLKERHALLPALPERFQLRMRDHFHEGGNDHHHGSLDPHFWLRCEAVRAVLPEIVDLLTRLDPEGEREFKSNAEDFGNRLAKIQKEVTAQLEPLKEKAVVQFHPSFNYFLEEHQLVDGGVVMMDPNVAPTAKRQADLLASLESSKAVAIFIEPQFDRKHAKALSEASGVPLVEVDPIGGVKGRKTYEAFVRWNADQILKAVSNE